MSDLAYHDELTGLPNRMLLDDRLSQAMHHAQRAGRLVGLLFLDLDRFKSINDTPGHVVGDLLLKAVAERLRVCVRATDTVARLGGDKMAVVLSGLTRMEDAGDVAQKILDTLSQPVQLDGSESFMTASIGITIFPSDDTSIDGLFKNADTAMSRAKEQGGKGFQFYTAEMNTRALERLTLENSLRYALERQEFLVYYQPQIDLETGEIIGAEALLRWNNPEVGLIPPSQFISLAEETGIIVSIGEWVLRSACTQAQAWHAAGFGPLQIAVNLSSRQFTHVNLLPMVADVLQETALPPGCLNLELTERIVMQDAEATIARLGALNRLGIRFSIDDFGTGYSSLSDLKRFPIHILKIDPSFIRDVTIQATDAAIVTSIITLAHSLRLAVVAEGVETQAQAEFLRAHGCDGVQGCLFSRPLTDNGFIQLLKERHRFRIGPLAA